MKKADSKTWAGITRPLRAARKKKRMVEVDVIVHKIRKKSRTSRA